MFWMNARITTEGEASHVVDIERPGAGANGVVPSVMVEYGPARSQPAKSTMRRQRRANRKNGSLGHGWFLVDVTEYFGETEVI